MKNRQHISILLTILLTVALVASGCSPQGGSTTVKELSGAGATFPYPLYSKMFDTYANATGVRVNYNSIGSGGSGYGRTRPPYSHVHRGCRPVVQPGRKPCPEAGWHGHREHLSGQGRQVERSSDIGPEPRRFSS